MRRNFLQGLRIGFLPLILIMLSFTVAACNGQQDTAVNPEPTEEKSTSTPVNNQMLRITNQSTFSIKNLVVRFPEDRVDFGDVQSGETTNYQVVPHGVYRYAAYDFEVDGRKYQQPVVDWVGESPVSGNNFTYILDVDPSKWETEGQVIYLVQVIED